MRLVYVQILRLVATVGVVGYHSIAAGSAHLKGGGPEVLWWFASGDFGVDLFFVISGFIICHTAPPKGFDARPFLQRRIWRIAPLYWLVTLLFCGLMLAAPRLSLQSASLDLSTLAKSLLFVSYLDGGQPIVSLGWTLEYEMIFYLVIAALAATRQHVWTCVIASLCGLSVFRNFLPTAPAFLGWHFIFISFLLEFALGVWVALALRDKRIPVVGLLALAVALGVLTLSVPASRIFLAGVPSAALVWMAAVLNPIDRPLRRIERTLATLGDASYSIYLVQIFSIPATARLVAAAAPSCPLDVFLIVSIIVTTANGYLVWRFVERPVLRFGRDRKRARDDVEQHFPERV